MYTQVTLYNMFIFILIVFFIIFFKQIVILYFPIFLYYCLYFLRLTLVLLLISLCTAMLQVNFCQEGSIKEHLYQYIYIIM